MKADKSDKTAKKVLRDDKIEMSRTQPKKSFLQKEFKELTAGEIVMVVALTAVTIVTILALRDVVREIMETIQTICFFSLLAVVLIATIAAGSKK